ncbi:pilus assembly protein TadG-related protein [Phenylobacterium hankyongense]|uniref:pilus assembly protein TadG-related protein n=1 Tax=Phenylobacterium hankyongense TaxID=1813876 RepID=UPI001401C7D5|nr:pilus assembly protein TadG-related protein [Phenylobacterium hankyongense]
MRTLGGDERGNVLIYVTVTAAVLMGMAGLALDASRATITHSEAQAAADGAALAGASQLDGQSGACGRAATMAANVTNRQRFAVGGASAVTIAAGSPRCLSTLPANDSTAIAAAQVATTDASAKFLEVTTQQLTHRNSLLDAVSSQHTALVQRTAVAGFRRSLCAAAPVMMLCETATWQPGVAFDAWSTYGGNKGFVSGDSCNSANCVHDTLASTTPSFCVTDAADPAPGNKTNKAQDGVNTRFGIGSTASQPSDTDIVNFSSYSQDITGGTGWNCTAYWAANHASDGLAKPTGCTATATAATASRYAVYQAERAAGKIPTAGRPSGGTPTSTQERRLMYLAVLSCPNVTPGAYLKAFMITPAEGTSSKTLFVEPIGLITSKTDPTVLHEEVQLYR